MAQTLLKVDNINVFYGNIHAVKDVSFEVNEGEIVTLIGANGAGKSTMLNAVAGTWMVDEGQIIIDGIDHPGTCNSVQHRGFTGTITTDNSYEISLVQCKVQTIQSHFLINGSRIKGFIYILKF